MVRLTDYPDLIIVAYSGRKATHCPDMTIAVYSGRTATHIHTRTHARARLMVCYLLSSDFTNVARKSVFILKQWVWSAVCHILSQTDTCTTLWVGSEKCVFRFN